MAEAGLSFLRYQPAARINRRQRRGRFSHLQAERCFLSRTCRDKTISIYFAPCAARMRDHFIINKFILVRKYDLTVQSHKSSKYATRFGVICGSYFFFALGVGESSLSRVKPKIRAPPMTCIAVMLSPSRVTETRTATRGSM